MPNDEFDVQATQAAINLLGSLLGDAKFRAEFKEHPKQASQDAGVDVDLLPDALFQALSEMSFEELAMVSRIQGILVDMDPPPGWISVAIFF